ncbi:MAG: glutamine-synthetase adenylyltransferase [Bryobacterales bacterium]|nr:glutamine-synthetase adenylyltransferase [Bryobacterales bacterium]
MLVLLRSSADPDGALSHLVKLHDESGAAFQYLSRSPASLQYLLTVFSHSRFLSDEVIRHPEWVDVLSHSGDLHRVITDEEYQDRLESRLVSYAADQMPSAIFALFRREQMFRIFIRDILAYGTLSDITEELSNLADAILHCAYRRIRANLVRRYGEPLAELSIIALGKLGGGELNYSSDIDLMFVYSAGGETQGPESISHLEFFRKVCIQLTDVLSVYTPHGACYRVDLRLRPEGTLGEICISLDAARQYYRKRARDWELQMLIKARVSAGERGPGRELLEFVEPLTYSSTLDFPKVEAVSEARHRISEKLATRRGNRQEFDIKLAPGGIRDIEFLVQCLQRLYGGKEPWVRHGGTLLALFRLRDKDLLSHIEYSRLATAYQFLRTLEHRLQIEDDRQTHSLPSSPEDMELLARRMTPTTLGTRSSAAELRQQVDAHLQAVREIYDRVVHTRLPAHYGADAGDTAVVEPAVDATAPEPVSVNLGLLLNQRAPGLVSALQHGELRYGARAFEHFLECLLRTPEWFAWLNDDPLLAGHVIDLFEHSPFFAEQLNRKPELLEEVRRMRLDAKAHTRYEDMVPQLTEPGYLRRFFNREMLHIQAESICLHRPIFETLERTSELADCAVASAYRMAMEHVGQAQPPLAPQYAPHDQMLVVALGRLGMREFDLASDADLVFVLPDGDISEIVFWTRVAERTIDILTAYTGDGVMFAVDTRLRPNGREGPLVQSEGAYKDYFARAAHAWEGITYMKARVVAGNLERGTRFLEELQDVDWRRYGQGGRSKEKLRHMRLRLEAQQGEQNPLKAGRGGYYDIDFALMYLRLKSAGIFYRVLNTPARVDVVERLGHLDRDDAQFLLDAATFYRAIDHALRLSSGHAEGRLPTAQLQIDMITELVSRWTPKHLHDQPLAVELSQIQTRTREFFDRIFR